MKKIYNILTLLFIAFLAACSQEERADKEAGDRRVCISAELPADIAATRAQIAVPTDYKLRCIIEVWTQNTSPTLKYRQEVAVEGGALPTFDFVLGSGDYDCLMWADFIKKDAVTTEVTAGDVTYVHYEDTFYDTSDLHTVSVDGEMNDNLFDTDLCDGFYANWEIKKNETAVQKTMKMKRPFAKLIVKENDAEKFASLNDMTVECQLPKAFNVATGEPTVEMATVVYSKVFNKGDDTQVLFTNYVFVPSTGLSVGNIILSFGMDTGKSICEIPAESIVLKRNQQLVANGELMAGGVVEPNPEPTSDPEVGDYFFIDGTWSSELTDGNKGNCIGIVYATGVLSGDDISSYGESAQGKSIKAYVMALKNTDVFLEDFPADSRLQYILSNSRPYFYRQNANISGKHEEVKVLSKAAADPDWVTYDGYAATEKMLSDESFTNSSTSLDYPVLHIFQKWKEKVTKPANASDWYMPSSGQLLEAAGVCYGFTPNEYYKGNGATQTIDKNTAFNTAFNNAIEAGIAEYFSSNNSANGYYIYTSTLNKDAMPMVIQIGTSRIAPHAKPNYKTMGLIRPFLTILK